MDSILSRYYKLTNKLTKKKKTNKEEKTNKTKQKEF
jgi:hypothetical protein